MMTLGTFCSGIGAPQEKACGRCGETKSLDQFHRQPTGKFGRFSYCKACSNAYYRGARKKRYDQATKRRWQLKTRYGLSPRDVEEMLAEQRGCCGICEVAFKGRHVIDHNHSTGKVRALLCHKCNVMIGGWDNPGWVQKALEYLRKHGGDAMTDMHDASDDPR